MTFIRNNYVCRRSSGGTGKVPIRFGSFRNWWLVKAHQAGPNSLIGTIQLGDLVLPKKYIGKRIMLRIEEVEDNVLAAKN